MVAAAACWKPPLRLVLAVLWLGLACAAAAQTAPGRATAGIPYTLPEWFKPSLLEIKEDVAEARKEGRRVLLFLHLDNCPYCARMLDESFRRGENHDFLRQHFDVISINVRGAMDVAWIDGKTYTEAALSRHLKVFGTPTLVFLDLEGNVALQLGGYRDPRALRQALESVQGGSRP